MIFVFGSNEAGRHGLGAAKVAFNRFGAIFGRGLGRQGNSYGIPTKDHYIETLPLQDINEYVKSFISYALSHPDEKFYVTRIGTGLAGYTDAEIAPMFESAPNNCYFDINWRYILGEKFKYFEGEL